MTLLIAESYLHQLDPFAIKFPAGWPLGGIHWYGLAYLTGFFLSWVLLRIMVRKGRSPLDADAIPDLVIYAVVGVLVGGRLGYCLFYNRHLWVEFDSTFPFWGVLRIHEGGMASHGGMIGVIVALLLFAMKRGLPKLHVLDLAAFVCPPGLFLGRLANFVNGELPGRALPQSMQADPPWWSVKYPEQLVEGAVDPSRLAAVRDQLAEALTMSPRTGTAELLEAAYRAAQAGQQDVIELVRPLLTAHYPSQIIQAITDGPILMGALALIWLRPRKPGVVGAWFLMIYGVLRIVTENYRTPDEGVALTPIPGGELTRGQLLSVLMVLAGAIGLFVVARRPADRLGGLLGPSEVDGPPRGDA